MQGVPEQFIDERDSARFRHLAQVPGEMPAFDRMWMGLMHLLTQLGARVHTRGAHWLAPTAANP